MPYDSSQDDSISPGKIGFYSLVGLLALIVIVAGITAFNLFFNRKIVNPQIRASQVEDPSKSIANRQLFHQEISSILSVDQQIDAAQQALTDFKAVHPRPWDDATSAAYDQTYNTYEQLTQVRQSDIADYNANAGNPDINRDRDACLPAHIDPTESVASEEQWISKLTC